MTNNSDGKKQADSKSSANAKKQQVKQDKQAATQAQPEASSSKTADQNDSQNSSKPSNPAKQQDAAAIKTEAPQESQATTAKPSPDPAQAPQSATTVVKRGWAGPVALVISLAALAGVGGIAYLDYDVRHFLNETKPFDPIKTSQLEAAKVESKLAESVRASSQQMSSQVNKVTSQLSQQQQQLRSTEQKLKQDVLGVAENISNLRRQFNQMQGTSRDDWQLAEVEYMLRLANQRLLTEGDIRGVEAILVSADAILRGLDNYSLYAVREVLANDLAAVRAVEQTDVEGTYLQLSALVNQVMELPLMPVSDYQKAQSNPDKEQKDDASLSDQLSAKLERTWGNFSDHLRININRDKPVQVLLTPKEEMFLRQNLRMMFEQAQLALLQQNQVIYRNSLEKAESWLKEYFIYESTKVAAINKQLKQLAAVKLSPKLPDISGSLKATKQYIDELHRLHKGKLPPKKDELASNTMQQKISVNLNGEAR